MPIAERAIALAERCGYVGGVAYGRNTLGCALVMAGEPRGVDELEASIALARASGLEEDVVRGYANLADCLSEQLRDRDLTALGHCLREGLAYADDRELGSGGFCMVGHLSEWSMLTGDWSEASRVAAHVADIASDAHRLRPLTVLGRLRARRGDPDAQLILDEALLLTSRLGETMWIGMARAARAEATWLAGDRDATLVEARAGLDLLARSSSVWLTSELAYWRWKAGDATPPPANLVEPYALQLAGRAPEAAECWRALGCPYEAARALTELDSAEPLREALGVFERLGAKRSAALVTQQLRGLGLRPPRGLRPSTRANPAQLTERELEVLALLADDLRDAEIAERLVLSSRTVGHHVSAILGKLGARSRGEAVRHATSLGIVQPAIAK
jgi:DNA-binding CsgD family transcriptional regulator